MARPQTDDAMAERVKSAAEKIFQKTSGSHDWEHTLRVERLCGRIGPAEDADMAVLRIAAYLHDIGRQAQDASKGKTCHAEKGAEMAQPIVSGLPIDGRRKDNIIHCIKTHRFRGRHAPESPEARVLFDADKIDAIGAVGVARAFLFAGEVGAVLHNPYINVEDAEPYTENDTGYREYRVKLSKIKDRMLTRTGGRIAADRHRFMADFFARFLSEYEGRV